MTEFEVWCSASSDTGVFFVGRAKADTFQEACDKVVHWGSAHYKHYCSASRSIWGCTLYPTYAEANGYRQAWSYTTGEELIIKVGEREVLRLPYRPMDNCTGICFPEAGWLAGKIKDMIDTLNKERYGK